MYNFISHFSAARQQKLSFVVHLFVSCKYTDLYGEYGDTNLYYEEVMLVFQVSFANCLKED